MKLNRSHKIVLTVLLAAQSIAASAQLTNAVAPPDYPKFLARYNIFNPNRLPNVAPSAIKHRTNPPPPKVIQLDSFSLVGIVGYSQGNMAGVYAFFDGTSTSYHKTVRLNDGIANFRVIDIAADSVTLMSDTNSRMVLRIGEQLHNDGVGHWLSADGVAANYNNRIAGYGNGRNTGRNNLNYNYNNGGGRQRRNANFGGGGNGYNYNNNGNGNFTRGRNNFTGPSAATANPQPDDPGMNLQDDNNMAPADDNAAPDTGPQDNTITPQDQTGN